MNEPGKRFIWLAYQMLRDCRLNDKSEQAELDEIVRRLEAMAGSGPNGTNGERPHQESHDHRG